MNVSNQSNRTTGDRRDPRAARMVAEWKRNERVREAANDMLAALQFLLSRSENTSLTRQEFASEVKNVARPIIAQATGVEP